MRIPWFDIGSVPMPLLLGAIFDQTCMVWKKNCGGEIGSCWIYDIQGLSLRLTVTAVVIKFLSSTRCYALPL